MPITQHTVLAIDASTERCSVALNYRGQNSSQVCDIPKSHAQALLPMVDALLSEAELTLQALDAIIVTLGPGSFTGIRICLSVAQGLTYGANLPLIGVNSLEVLAQGLVDASAPENSTLVSCLDARMSEVYWAAYTHQNGKLTEVCPPAVSSPEQFNAALALIDGNILGAGHGFSVPGVGVNDGAVNGAANGETSTQIKVDELPHATHILTLWDDASLKLALSHAATTEVEPLYLRNQVAWEKRKRIRTQD